MGPRVVFPTIILLFEFSQCNGFIYLEDLERNWFPITLGSVGVLIVIGNIIFCCCCCRTKRHRERVFNSIRKISGRNRKRGSRADAEPVTPQGDFEYDYAVPHGEDETGYEVPVFDPSSGETAPQPDHTAGPKGVNNPSVEPGHKIVQHAVSVESVEDAGYILVSGKKAEAQRAEPAVANDSWKRSPMFAKQIEPVTYENLAGGLDPGPAKSKGKDGGPWASLWASTGSVDSVDGSEGYIEPAYPFGP